MNAFESLSAILICGNYSSGKSFIAHKYFKDRKRINRNEIRRFLTQMTEHGRKWDVSDFKTDKENMVKHIEMTIIRDYLEKGNKIVIDNTALTKKSRARYLKEIARCNATVGCIYLEAPIQLLLARNRRRAPEDQVPENVLSELYAKREAPNKKEGFEVIKVVRQH